MGCPFTKIRGIVYDLDGTLIDTLGDLGHAVNLLRVEAGLTGLESGSVADCIGHGTLQLLECAVPGCDPPGLLPRFREIYRSCQTDRTRPYPGVAEALGVFSDRGIRQAVLTNKPEDSAKEILQALGLSCRLDPIRGAIDGRPLKPDPTVLLSIIADWGLSPAECLFIGDSAVDIETARRAGLPIVFISNGMGRRGEQAPDFEVSDFLIFLVEFCKATALAGQARQGGG
jgi:phosphoglycolate phosphatase